MKSNHVRRTYFEKKKIAEVIISFLLLSCKKKIHESMIGNEQKLYNFVKARFIKR